MMQADYAMSPGAFAPAARFARAAAPAFLVPRPRARA